MRRGLLLLCRSGAKARDCCLGRGGIKVAEGRVVSSRGSAERIELLLLLLCRGSAESAKCGLLLLLLHRCGRGGTECSEVLDWGGS